MKKIFFLSALLCSVYGAFAQSVSVGEKEFDAHPSAIMEIQSTTKGVLIPRLSAFQRSAVRVDSLSVGLLIYQTDEQSGFYYYDGVEWKHLAGGGNSGNDGILDNLSYVAFTGDYADLLNKPLLFSGEYADLTGIPATFDSNYFALKNLPNFEDSIIKYGFGADYGKLKNVPTEFVAKSHTHTKAKITDFSHTHTNADLPAYPTLESLNGVAGNDPRLSDARDPKAHDHHTLYYQKNETDSKLLGKSDVLHVHDFTELAGVPSVFDSNYFALKNRPNFEDSVVKYGFSGVYEDLRNIPVSVVFDSNYFALKNLPNFEDSIMKYGFDADYGKLKNVPTEFVAKSHTHTQTDITNFDHIHTKASIMDFDHTHTKSNITDFAHTHTKANITDFSHTHAATDFPTLAKVATSGNYNDLSDKPTIATLGGVSTTDARLSDARTPTAHGHTNVDLPTYPTLESLGGVGINDPRLYDARSANDVPLWAKQPNKPAYTHSEVGAAAASHSHTKSNITDFSHTHTNADLPTYPTLSSLGAAAASHGNHVPATESATEIAQNSRFLRNDNTWQTVTPANIGAVANDDARLSDARTPKAHTHTATDLPAFPTIPSYSTTTTMLSTDAGTVGIENTIARGDHTHTITPASIGATSSLTFGKLMFFAHTSQGTGDGTSWANAKAFSNEAYNAMPEGTAALLLGDGTKKYILTQH